MFIDIREPETNDLLCRIDFERDLLDIRHRAKKRNVLIDLSKLRSPLTAHVLERKVDGYETLAVSST